MKIIAFDSSGNVASVAYLVDGVVIAEYTLNHKITHSQTLLPMLDRIVTDAEIELSGIDAIAVAAGPGSFTGLRIGAATVKGLGLALEKPVIPVPTCEGLAYNLAGSTGLVVPIMDARRGQVYTGIYRVSGCRDCEMINHSIGESPKACPGTVGKPVIRNGVHSETGINSVIPSEVKDFVTEAGGSFGLRPQDDSSPVILSEAKNPVTVVEDQMAVSIEGLLEKLAGYGEPVTFLGDGVPVFRKTIEETCKVPFTFAPPQNALQRAASVAALAEAYVSAEQMLIPGQGCGSHDEQCIGVEENQNPVSNPGISKQKTGNIIRRMIPADDLAPIYLRKSQAEREHEAAAKKKLARDLETVACMEKELFSDAWSKDTLKDSIKYAYNHIFLIDTEGNIRPLVPEEDVADSFVVGEEESITAGYLIYADPADTAELHRIAILPEYRRKGLAGMLMQEMLRRCGHTETKKEEEPITEKQITEKQIKDKLPILLEVRAGNTPAIALYQSFHFEQVSVRKDYYTDPAEDAIIMRFY